MPFERFFKKKMPRAKKNTPPRVSVLMANHNDANFLGAAIESILSQSFTDFELIVVDDGSSDTSVSLLASYARRDKRLRVFCFPQNRGFTRALNHGLKFARGEYVARMDSDDLCHHDRLKTQVAYLDKHEKIHVLGCRYCVIDEEGSFCTDARALSIMDPIPISFGRHRVAKCVRRGIYSVLHASIVCRRSTLVSVGGYREFFPLGEDDDLYSRIVSLHGEVLDNLYQRFYYYRHYGDSLTQKFSHPFRILIKNLILLSSEFRRRGFWDPLDERLSDRFKNLRFRGVSSLLFLQDSLVFSPFCPRARLYHLLRVVVILRRFGLKNFYHISLWNDWNITLGKKIYLYLFFCVTCFRLKKFRAFFLYLRHVSSLLHHVLFSPITRWIFDKYFKGINISYYNTVSRLRVFRFFIFTRHWVYGLKYLLLAFFLNPFYTIEIFIRHFFVFFPFRKLIN